MFPGVAPLTAPGSSAGGERLVCVPPVHTDTGQCPCRSVETPGNAENS